MVYIVSQKEKGAEKEKSHVNSHPGKLTEGLRYVAKWQDFLWRQSKVGKTMLNEYKGEIVARLERVEY